MIIQPWHQDPKTRRNAAIIGGVVVLHAGLFAVAGLVSPSVPKLLQLPVIDVELIPPPQVVLRPPPEPPEQPTLDAGGGGQAAAPSVVHTPPKVRPVPVEVQAPVEKAPEPPLVVGVAPNADPTPGMGTGGQGTGMGGGSGSGTGAGNGSGSGVRTPPHNLRRPASGDIRRFHPAEALRQRISGVGVVRCRIQPDTTLSRCQVVSETPAGMGFGPAAISAATALYRFRPATLDGAYDDSVTVNVVVEFGRQAPVG